MIMQPDLVLYRTPKGEEALLSHDRKISTNQRRALLVVNGKTTVADLVKTAFWVTDLLVELQELDAMDLISDGASRSAAEMNRNGEPGQLLKAQLAAMAKELLGSNAERVIKKVEESEDSPEALEQVLLGCKKLIKLTISEEMADTFLQRGRKVIGK